MLRATATSSPATVTEPRRPALAANVARNREATAWRSLRWRAARRALWALLDRYVAKGARVAVVGVGNGHDVPLQELRRRTGVLDLIDVDGAALGRARRRLVNRAGVGLIAQDITAGRADAIARGRDAREPIAALADRYDVVVGDLLYTQLLYPALADAGRPEAATEGTLRRHGQPLTDAVVAALHASAPCVVHVHDSLGWWPGHPQPFSLADVLSVAERDEAAALELVTRGNVPLGCDPREASLRAGAEIVETAFWAWPFSRGVEYLVCATVTRMPR